MTDGTAPTCDNRRSDLEPLLAAATLTLAAGPVPDSARWVVPVGDVAAGVAAAADVAAVGIAAGNVPGGDVPGGDRLRDAAARLRARVRRSPRAALACGQLLRQTPALPTTPALAAEAAAYSLLLGGPEFARWLTERGAPRDRPTPPSPVRVSRDGARLTIVLDDPGRRNAFSAGLREALLEAVLLAEADETITDVRIRGEGAAFCGGGDLDEFGSATDLVAAYLVRLERAPWRVIDRIASTVTVHAHGACIGAGTEIIAFAGRVIAAPGSFFALPEVRMGLVPGAGGSVSVPRRIGRWRAAWLMLTGDRLARRRRAALGTCRRDGGGRVTPVHRFRPCQAVPGGDERVSRFGNERLPGRSAE